MKKALMILVAVIALIAIFMVVRDKDPESTPNNETATPSDNSTGHHDANGSETPVTDSEATSSVNIQDFSFTPASITVKKGTTVTWTNRDSTEHTVTSDEGSLMDSKLLGEGETYSVTFNEVGSFAYHCQPHPEMEGTVVVTE